jgi:lipopolysaccharide/colanic/teichoic acid biosynthesis glycosyltransferase
MDWDGGLAPSPAPPDIGSSADRIAAQGFYVRVIKPVLDRVLGLILLIVTAPIMGLAALAVLIRMGRPVIYKQARVGLHGKPFEIYKLRTMAPDRRVIQMPFNGQDRRRVHKSPNDPRVDSLGRILRAARLDELPQLWNVVRGDMSLIGPRPELPEIVKTYEPWEHQRHLVKPGITGSWQVSRSNGKLMRECVDIDIRYVERVSLWEDLSILIRTPVAMFGSRKGY